MAKLTHFARALLASAALFCCHIPNSQGAKEPFPPAVTLVAIDHSGGNSDPRPQGLVGWLMETRRRTSIDIGLSPKRVCLSGQPHLYERALAPTPLFVWQGDQAFVPLPKAETEPLAKALRAGGQLFIDVSDGVADGPFETSVKRQLDVMLPEAPWQVVPSDHVLYKSFYLVDRHGGRTNARAKLLGKFLGGRLAVMLCANDLLGALAKDPLGNWLFAAADGERAREMATRLAINWVMYSLCTDYKTDQVHLPFILKRRR